MDHKWKQDLQRKVAAYRESPPDIDRHALERRMAEAARAGQRRMTRAWARRIVAAAALAALAVPMVDRLLPEASAPETALQAITPPSATHAAGETIPPQEAATATSRTAAPMTATTTNGNTHTGTPAMVQAITTQPQAAADTADTQDARTAETTPADSPPLKVLRMTPNHRSHDMERPTTEHAIRHRRCVSASLFMANAMTSHDNAAIIPTILNRADPIGSHTSTLGGSYSRPQLAQSKPGTSAVHHRQPVRVGAKISYPIGNGWRVEGGLIYSYLYSELTSRNNNYSYETRQRLHYIGMPIAVSYTFWSGRRFSAYATAGGMIEKMVDGRADTQTIVGATVESDVSSDVSIRPLQLSAGGAMGIECSLADRIGAYVEPGFSYHFDNGSGVPTFYSEKPLAFSLCIGLRISLRGGN